MTDTKPTIEEQIKWIQSAVKAHENSGHILAILKELAAIKSKPVPVEPDKVLALARDAEMCNSHTAPGYLLANVEQLLRFAALIQREMKAEGWRQCAKGQGTTQFCGMAEELRKDAERYRWLQERCKKDLVVAKVRTFGLDSWSGDDLDAAIDRARSANE